MSTFAYPNMRGASEVNSKGPRSKCDQVIYEAIAKACEIIVSSRGNHGSDGGSSRFNLHTPEIFQVRSILEAWKHTLHVPIRLDVYYQHEGDRRELLERWCLEYKPASTERFLQVEGVVTQDPIVQLRHVCKRIVLWLRTLYCWTRLLPAQSLNNHGIKSSIGFSIYVNSERKDDVTDLTQNQGFRWQNQQSPVVSPYGELEWRVIYSSNTKRLLRGPQPSKSLARPIPGSVHGTNTLDSKGLFPQSAPAHFAVRTNNSGERNGSVGRKNLIHQNTYDPGRFLRPLASSPKNVNEGLTGLRDPLQRRHTSIGQSNQPAADAVAASEKGNEEPPERVLSGLSLAMMSINQDGDDNSDTSETGEASSKRHAALHEVPPHLREKHPQAYTVPASGEYGYGYNAHIPWQKIHPSSNNPVAGQSYFDTDSNNNSFRNLMHSPSALASTPPSAAFLGATPPTTATLIPPRSALATPPFLSRPAGFVNEPTSAFLPSQPDLSAPTDTLSAEPAGLPPPTSLDLLHSSPFHNQTQFNPLVASLSGVGDGSILKSSGAERPLWGTGLPPSTAKDEEEYEEEMPFAVEEETTSSNIGSNAGSSLLYASSAVASFAQKCAPNQRLSIFESTSLTSSVAQSTDDLASQLSEFHSFGASLQTSAGSESTNASTPISLRT